MEFRFKNFGQAGSGTIGIRDLTIIFGPNNTGKTSVNYAIYSILKNFQTLFDFGVHGDSVKKIVSELLSNGTVQIDLAGVSKRLNEIKSGYVKIIGSEIHKYLQLPESSFLKSEISLKLSEIDLTTTVSHLGKFFDNLYWSYEYCDQKCRFSVYLKENEDGSSNFSRVLKSPDFKKFLHSEINSLICKFHYAELIPNPFAITSERTGVACFYKSHDYNSKKIHISMLGQSYQDRTTNADNLRTQLAESISDNIDYVRYYEGFEKTSSFIVRENIGSVTDLLADLIDCGTYELLGNSLQFVPNSKFPDSEPAIPIQSSSSAIKSLFLFDMFVNHVAEKGSILIIDEPELNLFIEKQVKIARLIARLVNAGVKVLLTTYSDHLVREINNLITLKIIERQQREKIMNNHGILECDLLEVASVSGFHMDANNKIESLHTFETGINPDNWNDLIDKENMRYEKIYRSIGE